MRIDEDMDDDLMSASEDEDPLHHDHDHTNTTLSESEYLNTRVLFRRVPSRPLKPTDMKVVKARIQFPLPPPHPNHIIIRNKFVSVDANVRTHMEQSLTSYIEPFVIGEPLHSSSIAEVIAVGPLDPEHSTLVVVSGRVGMPKVPGTIKPGDLVIGDFPWEEYCELEIGPEVRKLDPDPKIPLSLYLSIFGWPGQTAYTGLYKIAKPKKLETILVSDSAGAVGQLVGQIAKIHGLRVIGSAGSDQKTRFLLDELRFDGAFNYRSVPIDSALAEFCPRGIDIYFENVGGELLEAVLPHMNDHGRIPVGGMISMYSDSQEPHAIANLYFLLSKQIRMEGFMVESLPESSLDEFMRDMMRWYNEGRIVYKENIVDGLENAPEALANLFQNRAFGKTVVKV
ncbi:hypothetical protein HDU76_010812 [Blyttiomyces sp. JEL0837]|nr:hypothetical protein HDU76_010812 [Blyttiomyces sp. JEL0837]